MRKLSFRRQVATQFTLLLVALFIILPLWGILRLAFDGSIIGRPTEFRLLPKQFSLVAFLKVFENPYQSINLAILLKNSLIVSLGAAIIALILGSSLAYALARFRFPGRQLGLFTLLLTALLPPIAFSTPLYIVLSLLKIRSTLIGLTIVYATFAMPFCIWNMRSAFQAVPLELEEAAFLDGAGVFTCFRSITLPIAMPSLAVASLIAFLMAYSEFAIGWFFVEKPDTVTLAMSIYASLQTQYQGLSQPWNILGSMVLIMSIPVMIIFIILQHFLLERMMFGSIQD
jgi:arabinogalactan oligomer/maltooligosaccharide transport system permease protein